MLMEEVIIHLMILSSLDQLSMFLLEITVSTETDTIVGIHTTDTIIDITDSTVGIQVMDLVVTITIQITFTMLILTILEDMDIAATIATTMHTVRLHTGMVVQLQVATM